MKCIDCRDFTCPHRTTDGTKECVLNNIEYLTIDNSVCETKTLDSRVIFINGRFYQREITYSNGMSTGESIVDITKEVAKALKPYL